MAIAHVQSAELVQTNVSGATVVKAFAGDVTVGSLLIASCIWKDGGVDETNTLLTDTLGQTWAKIQHKRESVSLRCGELWYCANSAAGANTVTVTLPTARLFKGMIVSEFSGLATLTPHNTSSSKSGTLTSTSADATTGTAITTTQDGCLIYSSLLLDNSAVAIGVGTGFTERIDSTNGQQMQHLTQATAGSAQALWTAANTVDHYIAMTAAFNVAGIAAVKHGSTLLGFG